MARPASEYSARSLSSVATHEVEPSMRRILAPFQPAQCSVDLGFGSTVTRQRLLSFVKGANVLLGLHHQLPRLGKLLLFIGFGCKLAQFGNGMFEIIALGFSLGHERAVIFQRRSGIARRAPQGRNSINLPLQATKRIQQPAVGRNVNKSAVGMLAMDFHQFRRHLAQEVQAHGLVVDCGTARPIGVLHPADDDLAFAIDVIFFEQQARCVAIRQCKSRGHCTLGLAAAHQG